MIKEINPQKIKPGTQFIKIWAYDGELWCETCKRKENGEFLRYNEELDEWEPDTNFAFPFKPVQYFVKGEL